jgi:excisionase family DNA binding protein
MAKKTTITIPQAAKAYGVSPTTVRRWIASGRVTAYRVGPRMIRLDSEILERELKIPVEPDEPE